MTALLRRFDCGHTEFTGRAAPEGAGWFATIPLGVAGPCAQCIAEEEKRLVRLASEIGEIDVEQVRRELGLAGVDPAVKFKHWLDEQEPMTQEEAREIAERIKNWQPKPY